MYFDKPSEVFPSILFTKTYNINIVMTEKAKSTKFSLLFLKKRLENP